MASIIIIEHIFCECRLVPRPERLSLYVDVPGIEDVPLVELCVGSLKRGLEQPPGSTAVGSCPAELVSSIG